MKTVLITGASKGIGAEIARTLAKEGYNVAINFNKSESAAVALKNELEKYTSVMLVKADVSKYDEVASMVSAVRNKFGSITHLVCNAGISVTGLLEDMDLCQCDSVIDTNLKGVIYTVKEVIPDMVKRKSGVIVNVSSIWGENGRVVRGGLFRVESGRYCVFRGDGKGTRVVGNQGERGVSRLHRHRYDEKRKLYCMRNADSYRRNGDRQNRHAQRRCGRSVVFVVRQIVLYHGAGNYRRRRFHLILFVKFDHERRNQTKTERPSAKPRRIYYVGRFRHGHLRRESGQP